MCEEAHASRGVGCEQIARAWPVDVGVEEAGAVCPYPSLRRAVARSGGDQRAVVKRCKMKREQERPKRVAQASLRPLVHDDWCGGLARPVGCTPLGSARDEGLCCYPLSLLPLPPLFGGVSSGGDSPGSAGHGRVVKREI